VPAIALETEALRADALRVNTRYVEEVVIGWDLCPWAARAWRQGEVERRVIMDAAPQMADVARVAAELVAQPRCAVGLLIFPRVTTTVSAWESFAEQLRRVDAAFLVAAFHPAYRASGTAVANAAQLVSLIRRTPDPTLQLVRSSLVDSLARDGRDLSAEIARDNFARVSARTPAALEALLDDICTDRERAFRP
jgi:uncharacterized protein